MKNSSHNNSPGYAVCESCGEQLPLHSTFCPNCGSRKIAVGGGREKELPTEESAGYYASGFNPPVGPDSPYDEYSDEGCYMIGDLYNETPYQKAPYPEESYQEGLYERQPYPEKPYQDDGYFGSGMTDEDYDSDDYDEDEDDYYVSSGQPTASSVRIAFAALFVAAVFAVAFIGLIISFFPESDSPEPVAPAGDSSVTDVSSTVSSQAKASHDLPDEAVNGKTRIFAVADNKFGSVTAFDGDPDTCWQDGVAGYGVGEWLLAFNEDNKAVKVSSVTVYNGYQNLQYNTKSKDMYLNNSRVAAFELEFDDGSTESFTLEDSKEPQTFKFKARETCYVRFTVEDVYKGKKYKDTCIGEIIYK